MNVGRFAHLRQQFLVHTHAELAQLSDILAQAQQGQPEALLSLKHSVHRIHGSAAMLGFNPISAQAGKIERLLRQAEETDRPVDWSILPALIGQLTALLHSADQTPVSDSP